MSSSLDQLYGDVIRDHQRDPRNFGCSSDCSHREEGYNPLCGDKVLLGLKPRADGKGIEKLCFEGEGCSISMASASMLTEEVAGLSFDEASAMIQNFRDLMQGQEDVEFEGDLQALAGVRRFPVRIKCALLPWMTLKKAIETLGSSK